MIIRRFPSPVHMLCFRFIWVSRFCCSVDEKEEDEDEERQNATLDDFEFVKFFATFNGYIMNKPARYNHFWA